MLGWFALLWLALGYICLLPLIQICLLWFSFVSFCLAMVRFFLFDYDSFLSIGFSSDWQTHTAFTHNLYTANIPRFTKASVLIADSHLFTHTCTRLRFPHSLQLQFWLADSHLFTHTCTQLIFPDSLKLRFWLQMHTCSPALVLGFYSQIH